MNLRRPIQFALDHKVFAFKYALSLALALCLLTCSLALAVYSVRLQEVMKTKIGLEKHLLSTEGTANNHENDMANLSPAQWQQVNKLLAFFPMVIPNIVCIHDHDALRRETVLSFNDFVFKNYQSLPQQTRDDWQALKQLPDLSAATSRLRLFDESRIQDDFLTSTLNVWEIKQLLEIKAIYEKIDDQIATSSQLIDRIVPVLVANGFDIEKKLVEVSRRHPEATLYKYMTSPRWSTIITGLVLVPNFVFPPEKPPTLDLTLGQLIDQLAQPALSHGNTSADRAELNKSASSAATKP